MDVLNREMANTMQHTIQQVVGCDGVGLHTGKPVRLRLLPGPVGTGIIFIQKGMPNLFVPADARYVMSTAWATTLGRDGITVKTVEHLLSAVFAMDIQNLVVELSEEEVPIMDGSAMPFVRLLKNAGRVTQEKEKTRLFLTQPIEITDGNRSIAIYPADVLHIEYFVDYPHPKIGKQSYSYRHSRSKFIRQIASARTFGFLSEIRLLQKRGLVRGGSLQNSVVMDERGVRNPEPFRFPDEMVRHKILDLMGDLALLGSPVAGRIVAHRAGHTLHAALVKAILANNPTPAWDRGRRTSEFREQARKQGRPLAQAYGQGF